MMTKKDNKDFYSIKCWTCDNTYADADAKVRTHCHISRKYRGSLHRRCNINLN